jgi:4-hydroxyphenylpyruvate dioxygenase
MAPRFLPAIASQSIGRAPHHHIETKLALIAAAGFHAIELFFEDLELVATRMRNTTHPPPTPLSDSFLLAAARYIHQLCIHHNLHIICLQPFANYEGLLCPTAHTARIRELHLWIRLAQALHTDLIQIPSSYLPATECTSSRDRVVNDLRCLADIGLSHNPPIRFAHEALAWATHADHWDQVYSLVEAVDRPNFGTCLDTFNLLGREYADPTSPTGKTADADAKLQQTLHNLRTRLDPNKVFYIEAVDGERLDAPLDETHPFYNPEQRARMSWSRNARLFPFEDKGYLPVKEVLQAIVDAGYEGYVAFEFFSRTAHEAGQEVPREHVKRASRSWRKMCEEMGWEDCLVEKNGGGLETSAERQSVSQVSQRREVLGQSARMSLAEQLGGGGLPALQAH